MHLQSIIEPEWNMKYFARRKKCDCYQCFMTSPRGEVVTSEPTNWYWRTMTCKMQCFWRRIENIPFWMASFEIERFYSCKTHHFNIFDAIRNDSHLWFVLCEWHRLRDHGDDRWDCLLIGINSFELWSISLSSFLFCSPDSCKPTCIGSCPPVNSDPNELLIGIFPTQMKSD